MTRVSTLRVRRELSDFAEVAGSIRDRMNALAGDATGSLASHQPFNEEALIAELDDLYNESTSLAGHVLRLKQAV